MSSGVVVRERTVVRPGVVRLRPRAMIAISLASVAGLLMFLWPLIVAPESDLSHSADAPLLFALILPMIMAIVLAEISEGGLDVKAVAMLGVLSAIGAALRPMGAGTGGLETMFFLLILGGRVFGPGFGFVLGATTLFASALITGGVGPWLPFQMMASAWVGMFAGLLPRAKGRAELALLAAYGAIAALLYGFVMNLSFWPFTAGLGTGISYVAGDPVLENLHRFFTFSFATSLGWDIGRAITNVTLILIVGPMVLSALRRAARKASFDAVPRFLDAR
ncbi:ECF transporter S component [Blastococcus sp. Marseille-P5729]|uniref:ECF transporter S component n=1 Tax=Blastococcus sp. Marseille-P5729 TaxID=2086582 RepID=UPI000D0E9F00|nr:ECF transporter S component [Blastococcus sp. Marseille-P5729]